MRSIARTWAVAAVAALLASTAVETAVRAEASVAAPVRLVDLGTLGGACCSEASAINDRGQVVGASQIGTDPGAPSHAVRWERGRVTDLGTLGGAYSGANGINERGDVVGGSELASPGPGQHAFLWRRGRMLDLGTLGGTQSWATDVNDHGVVVGTSSTANGSWHSFRWADGQMVDLGSGEYSRGTGINDRGEISATWNFNEPVRWWNGVGTSLPLPTGGLGGGAEAINRRGSVAGFVSVPSGNAAALWRGGRLTVLAVPPGLSNVGANGINDCDEVVGGGDGTALHWSPRRVTALPNLAGGRSYALDINNHGQIVGQSETSLTIFHAVLWTR
ncbi:MAG TPA: hypothetical protein VMU51_10680 [Mycobacteriales bacterium]|nr:hypothetical protein [Mycobacteriales bacterium]